MEQGQILIVPFCGHGHGGGHLVRCIKLTCDLRAMGREAFLYLPSSAENIETIFIQNNINPTWRVTDIESQKTGAKKTDFIIMDFFQTSCDELSRWKKIAPVIGIDEGGSSRGSFDFLIDILVPEKLGNPSANITSPSLLPLPKKQTRSAHSGKTKILVSFGQEDSAELGIAVTRSLCAKNDGGMEITYLRGSLADKKQVTNDLKNVQILNSIPNLAEHLNEYDLVITHYGITAYEALYAGAAVLLASPTPYHKKLAKAAGFRTINEKGVSHLLYGVSHLKKYCEKLSFKHGLDKEGDSLTALVNSFLPQVNQKCPVCGGERPERIVARFKDRTYRRCQKCGIIYMDRTCPPPIEYEREYFFENYRKQYGKTYIEDFPNLTAMAKRRLKIIKKLGGKKPLLLDIGCAYGPFLAAAREEGFSPFGIDPAEDAVRYVQEKLNIPAALGFFPNCLPSPTHDVRFQDKYDVITLWYVIEHFQDCVSVLIEIKKILKHGGILAFSTPSFSGISGNISLKKFLLKSPSDHFTIWSPKMCKKALALYGFKVKKIILSGHHPERFPLLGKFAKSKKSPLYWLFLAFSKIFGLGDTFEVYALLQRTHITSS